jgi:hypothetical protein
VSFPVSFVILRVREHYNALFMRPFFINEKIPCMAMAHRICTAVQRCMHASDLVENLKVLSGHRDSSGTNVVCGWAKSTRACL